MYKLIGMTVTET